VTIPDQTRDRVGRAGDDAWREGLNMATELIAELRGQGEAGIYLMPQFARFDRAAELVDRVRAGVS